MARLQILELPEGNGDDRPPFILVIDQVDNAESYLNFASNPERLGARAILLFEETIEIPANDVPLDLDGYPLKVRVEGDFEQFREQAQDEIRKAQADLQAGMQ